MRVPDRPGVAQHVVVREHHALRIRGRAGGELDEQQVVRRNLGGECVERGVRYAVCEREEFIEATSRLRNFVADDDDVLQQRQRVPGSAWSTAGSASRRNARKSMLRKRSAENSTFTSACLRQKRELRRLEARVDRHGDRADRGGGIEQRHPGLVVAEQDADEIAAAGHRARASPWQRGAPHGAGPHR